MLRFQSEFQNWFQIRLELRKMASYGGQASDGMRAARHAKARQIEIEDAELRKKKIADSLKLNIENKFAAHYDAVEMEIKASTVWIFDFIFFKLS